MVGEASKRVPARTQNHNQKGYIQDTQTHSDRKYTAHHKTHLRYTNSNFVMPETEHLAPMPWQDLLQRSLHQILSLPAQCCGSRSTSTMRPRNPKAPANLPSFFPRNLSHEPGGLEKLPPELWLLIAGYLSLSDQALLAMSSPFGAEYLSESWRHLQGDMVQRLLFLLRKSEPPSGKALCHACVKYYKVWQRISMSFFSFAV